MKKKVSLASLDKSTNDDWRKYNFFLIQTHSSNKNLQCISSFTEVEAGTEMLLLLAWQVKMEWRSVLRNCTSLSSLVTLPETSSTTSDTSSSSAWSRHHVTLGVGRPEREELECWISRQVVPILGLEWTKFKVQGLVLFGRLGRIRKLGKLGRPGIPSGRSRQDKPKVPGLVLTLG